MYTAAYFVKQTILVYLEHKLPITKIIVFLIKTPGFKTIFKNGKFTGYEN